jgi:hypothetical protein
MYVQWLQKKGGVNKMKILEINVISRTWNNQHAIKYINAPCIFAGREKTILFSPETICFKWREQMSSLRKIVSMRNQWSRADFWHHCNELYRVLPGPRCIPMHILSWTDCLRSSAGKMWCYIYNACAVTPRIWNENMLEFSITILHEYD